MTELLIKAFEEAGQLPEDDQNSFAEWLLAELHSEHRWTAAFAKSSGQLARLADAALREDAAGKTNDLDPESL